MRVTFTNHEETTKMGSRRARAGLETPFRPRGQPGHTGRMTSVGERATRSVLVVEDERPLAQLVVDYLTRIGLEAVQVHDGALAVTQIRQLDPDLVVLDLGLPGLDGIEVCRQVRTFSDCHIIMLTARSEEIDLLLGLGVGADDYMTKPFSPRELTARVQAALRRPRASRSPSDRVDRDLLSFDGLTIRLSTRETTRHGTPVSLTRTEFDLLVALASQPRRVFSRRQLLDAVWDENWVGDEHIVDVYVAHVRRKLADDATEARIIETIRGVGYRFALEPSSF